MSEDEAWKGDAETSPAETSMDSAVTTNKSRNYYTQYLFSGHGTSRGVRQPIVHVLKGI